MLVTSAVPAAHGQSGPPAVGQTAGKPALILNVASYEQLRSSLFYLARLVGQDDAAAQLDLLIALRAGDSGLAGLDLRKPIGAYGWVGTKGTDDSLVLMVPVANQRAFLDLLENFDIHAERGDDGVYSADVEDVPDTVYLRFAHDYAYVTTRNPSILDRDKLLAPDAVLRPGGRTGVLSVTVNVDRIPGERKDRILDGMELPLAVAKERDVPNETQSQKKFRQATLDEIASALRTLMNEGSETSLRVDLDRHAGDLMLTMAAQGKSGSAMAAAIQKLGQARSVTSGLLNTDAALNFEVNVSLPQEMREMLGPLIADGRRRALAAAKDDSERKKLTALLEALMPTLEAAELDETFNLQGPGSDGRYVFVGGIKVRDGARLEKLFRETAVKDVTTDVRLDVAKVGTVGVDRIRLKDVNDDARRTFGDDAVYVAFRDDAVLVATGAGGLDAIKKAVSVAPSAGKVLEVRAAVARLAPLAHDGMARVIARQVFGDTNSDRIRLTLEGGKTLKLQLSMKTKVIEYASQIDRAARK